MASRERSRTFGSSVAAEVKLTRADDIGSLGEHTPADTESLLSDAQAHPSFGKEIVQCIIEF